MQTWNRTREEYKTKTAQQRSRMALTAMKISFTETGLNNMNACMAYARDCGEELPKVY